MREEPHLQTSHAQKKPEAGTNGRIVERYIAITCSAKEGVEGCAARTVHVELRERVSYWKPETLSKSDRIESGAACDGSKWLSRVLPCSQ